MTAAEQANLDNIADRLGDLYQAVGRLEIDETVQSDLLDVVLGLTQDVEAVSGRVQRNADECH